MMKIAFAITLLGLIASSGGAQSSANGRAAIGQSESASSSNLDNSAGLISPQWPCPADFDADGFVNDGDFGTFFTAYDILDCSDPAMPVGCPADFNGNGFVEDFDFVVFVVAYANKTCQIPAGGEMP